MPPSRSWDKACFSSITFIRFFSSFKIDQIAILGQLANEGIDLPQSRVRSAFQISADKTVFVDFQFQCRGTGIVGGGGSKLFCHGEHAQDATDPGLTLMAMDRFTECADVRSRAGSAGQQLCGT